MHPFRHHQPAALASPSAPGQNTPVRIDLRSLDRKRLFRVEVNPEHPPSVVQGPPETDYAGKEVFLDWDRALDDEDHLRRCPVCGCRELFVRRDFPQVTGFVVVVLAAVISLVLLGRGSPVLAVAVLAAVVLIDVAFFFFTGRCLVCYRCRSEYRNLPIPKDHPGWDLAVGEKYRQDWQRAESKSKAKS